MDHTQSSLLEEIELMGVLPLLNLIPENPKLKRWKKVIESRWKWKKQIWNRPIIWNRKKREKRKKQRIKNKQNVPVWPTWLRFHPGLQWTFCVLFGKRVWKFLIERRGEDLRVEVEGVKKKRERGYGAVGFFLNATASLTLSCFSKNGSFWPQLF